MLYGLPNMAGCSAVWLAHYTGGVGVGGSNPLSPTIEANILSILLKSQGLLGGFESPTGWGSTQGGKLRWLFAVLFRVTFAGHKIFNPKKITVGTPRDL